MSELTTGESKMNYLKITMLSLVLVSSGAIACDLGDYFCAEREARRDQQIESIRIEQEQQERDFRYEMEQQRYEIEQERNYQERERLHFEQDNTGVRDIICDWSDSDC